MDIQQAQPAKISYRDYSWQPCVVLACAALCIVISQVELRAQGRPDVVWMNGGHAAVTSVAFSQDGKTLASGAPGPIWGTIQTDATIKLWRLSDGALLRTLIVNPAGNGGIAFAPDGRLVAPGVNQESQNVVSLLSASDFAPIWSNSLPGIGGPRTLGFSYDGRVAIDSFLGSWDFALMFLNLDKGQVVRSIPYGAINNEMALSPDWLIAGFGNSGILKRVDDEFVLGQVGGSPLAFSPDGSSLLIDTTGPFIGSGALIRVADRTVLWTHGYRGDQAVFSPDGATVILGGGTPLICFQVSDGKVLWKKDITPGSQNTIALSPEGTLVASGDYFGEVKLWRASDCTLLRTLTTGHKGSISSVAFASGMLASAASDKSIRMSRISDGNVIWTATNRPNAPTALAVSSDGALLASAEGVIPLWRSSDGSLARTLPGHPTGVNAVSFSPDNGILASAGFDRTIKLWQVSNGAILRTLTGHASNVTTVAFSPNGKHLASGSSDMTIRIWQPTNGTVLQTLTGQGGKVISVSFSADGSLMASATDNSIKIWSTANWGLLRNIALRETPVSVAFAPDSNTLAVVGDDQTVKLWRASDGNLLRTYDQETYQATSVAFSKEGNLFAFGRSDGTLVLARNPGVAESPFKLEPRKTPAGIEISWLTSTTGAILESTGSLSNPASWESVTNSPVVTGARTTVSIGIANSNRFYRLRRQ